MKKIEFSKLILFEDEDYIVINKPAFVSTLDDRVDKYSILEIGREYFPAISAGHRLDKETSGVLVLTKNKEAYRNFAMQLERREVKKVYHAISDGRHEFIEKEIDAPLYTHGSKSLIDPRRGKLSQTIVTTMKIFKFHTLINCKPITGRMHQIRVHLASIGAPIAGDSTYGGKPVYLSDFKRGYNLKNFEEERPLITRTSLHAFSITFKGVNQNEISIEAPYSKDMNAFINQLEKAGR